MKSSEYLIIFGVEFVVDLKFKSIVWFGMVPRIWRLNFGFDFKNGWIYVGFFIVPLLLDFWSTKFYWKQWCDKLNRWYATESVIREQMKFECNRLQLNLEFVSNIENHTRVRERNNLLLIGKCITDSDTVITKDNLL